MTSSLDPVSSLPPLLTPEISMQSSVVLQAHHTAFPTLPSPQLLTAFTMGVPYRPLAPTQHFAQYATPSLGGQFLELAGAQHLLSPLPGTVPVQQLLLPHAAQYTT